MIKSMTGYGRACGTVENLDITVELRCVNHRYLDLSVKTPRMYAFLEDTVRNRVQKSISRGKLDVYISIDHTGDESVHVSLNHHALEGYLSAVKQMNEVYGLTNDITASSASRFPDVFIIKKQQEDDEVLKKGIENLVGSALEEFNTMREREGQRLRDDILSRAHTVRGFVEEVEKRSKAQAGEYREKLFSRMKEVLDTSGIDEQRILLEAAIYADRCSVDEETVRLKSHLLQLDAMAEDEGAVGRKMDFLIQEINREANTIGSKANDIELARIVVDIKAEIEKIREQAQNVE